MSLQRMCLRGLFLAVLGTILAFMPKCADAALVTWVPTDMDGAANGITADLMVGSDLVGTATITRSGVTRFGTPTWNNIPGAGLELWEIGQNNANPHSATYDVVLDSVSPGWEFTGFGLSQYPPSGGNRWAPDPDYEFTFNSGAGALATVTDPAPPDYFLGIPDGGTFGSGTILDANENASGRGDGQILSPEAELWQIDFDPAITDYTLTYSTNAVVNNDSLFFTANAIATPEPSSLLLCGAGLGGLALRRRRRKRQTATCP